MALLYALGGRQVKNLGITASRPNKQSVWWRTFHVNPPSSPGGTGTHWSAVWRPRTENRTVPCSASRHSSPGSTSVLQLRQLSVDAGSQHWLVWSQRQSSHHWSDRYALCKLADRTITFPVNQQALTHNKHCRPSVPLQDFQTRLVL